MYDLKPEAPAGIRGELRAIETRVSGVRICEHLPLQAAQMDKIALVRSVSHHNPSHLPSSHLLLTGYEPPGVPERRRSSGRRHCFFMTTIWPAVSVDLPRRSQ
jgi:hypothetical protein